MGSVVDMFSLPSYAHCQLLLKWETYVIFLPLLPKALPLGQTLELVISQFWSSDIRSHETTTMDFDVLEFLFR